MHICFVALYHNPALAGLSPREYVDHIPLVRQLPEALAARGHRVSMVQAYPQAELWRDGGVSYHFVPAGAWESGLSRILSLFRTGSPTGGQLALTASSHIKTLAPDVIHFYGLLSSLNLFWLLRSMGQKGPPVVGHYHGGSLSNNPLVRLLQKHNLGRLSQALFTTSEHARPFIQAGMLREDQVVELVEVSTEFRRRPRESARKMTRMDGSPVFLWAGRLHPVKEPMVALRGFEIIAESWPEARLYLYYLTGELLPELKTYLLERPSLAQKVHFRGRVPNEEMEAIYNSADFLLQASSREFSGYALLEAMACGVIPLVTDIPAFRAITAGGRYGILFPVGDHRSLARQALAFDLAHLSAHSEEVSAYFQRSLSFLAMAERLEKVYRETLLPGSEAKES